MLFYIWLLYYIYVPKTVRPNLKKTWKSLFIVFVSFIFTVFIGVVACSKTDYY